jgi:hypothetical protein
MKKSVAVVLLSCWLLAFGTASADPASEPPSGPDPAVQKWPAWPYLASCGGLPFDPVAVFSGPTGAELGSEGPEAALRRFLRNRYFPWINARHWRRIAGDERTVEFASGRLSSQLETVMVELDGGRWKDTGYSSDCDPTSIVGNGPVVTWDLARQGKPLKKWARKVRVNLGGGPCSGGRPQNPRARAVFQPLSDKLLMTIWLRPLPAGVYTCEGISEPPLTVRLPERIRLSRLWDGATYPPTPALGR